MNRRLDLRDGPQALTDHRDAWDALAAARPSPYLTHAWLRNWADAAPRRVACALLTDGAGELCAGAAMLRVPGGFAAPMSADCGDWDAVARTAAHRQEFWQAVAALRPVRLQLQRLREDDAGTGAIRPALLDAGYGLLAFGDVHSPFVELPKSFDELLAGRSPKLRATCRRSRRVLGRTGAVRLRAVTGGPMLDRELTAFLRVEASGWKQARGTAILADARRERFFRAFAREAAERGWLRLQLLELDGDVIAGNLWCSIGGEGFGLKMGFDPAHARLAPGFVLLADVLETAIAEGLGGFDLGGAPDEYKLRWTDQVRARAALGAYRGTGGRVAAVAWRRARPAARRWRRRWAAAHQAGRRE